MAESGTPGAGQGERAIEADYPSCVAVRNEGRWPSSRWYLCTRTDLHCSDYGSDNEGHVWSEVPADVGASRWRDLTESRA